MARTVAIGKKYTGGANGAGTGREEEECERCARAHGASCCAAQRSLRDCAVTRTVTSCESLKICDYLQNKVLSAVVARRDAVATCASHSPVSLIARPTWPDDLGKQGVGKSMRHHAQECAATPNLFKGWGSCTFHAPCLAGTLRRIVEHVWAWLACVLSGCLLQYCQNVTMFLHVRLRQAVHDHHSNPRCHRQYVCVVQCDAAVGCSYHVVCRPRERTRG